MTSNNNEDVFERWKQVHHERKATLTRLLTLQHALQEQKEAMTTMQQEFFQTRAIYLTEQVPPSRYIQTVNDLMDVLYTIVKPGQTVPPYLETPLQVKELLIVHMLEQCHWISLLDSSQQCQKIMKLLKVCTRQPEKLCFPGFRIELENAETQLQKILRWKRSDANVYVPGQEDQDILEDNPDLEREQAYLLEQAGLTTASTRSDTLAAETNIYSGGAEHNVTPAAAAQYNDTGALSYDDFDADPDDEAHIERLLHYEPPEREVD